jgi:PAS domain S-box-containing protein
MKTPQAPKDNNDEIAKENIQKRLDNLYSKQELPSHASISEVDAMKARINELEAKLALQELAGFEPQASPIEKSLIHQSRALEILSQDMENAKKPSSEKTSIHQPFPKPERKKTGFFRDLFRAPTFADIAKNRVAGLQHRILLGLFFVSLLSIITLILTGSEQMLYSLGVTSIEIVLSALAFFWMRRGHVERTSWLIISSMYLVFILGFSLSGYTFTIGILLAILISLAGVMLRFQSVMAVTVIAIGTLEAFRFFFPSLNSSQNQSLFIPILLGLLGTLLTIASRAFEESFTEANRNKEDILHANRDLQNLTQDLEQRVIDRTHDLELASEVGRSITERVGNLSDLLSQSAELIRSKFSLYYTQIYIVDPSGRSLVLRAGTGTAGAELMQRGHRLSISSASLNGRAALERHAAIVGDTQQSSNFLPNPLLPLTRSELAIPLIANDKVVGVLDMQSERPEAFSEANLSAFQVLAGQFAIAIQNAALFKEVGEARLVVEEQAARLTGSSWQQFMNAVDRNENIGYVFSRDEVLPWVEAESPVFDNTLTVPIKITGATVGEVQLADGTNRKWSTAETEIVRAAVSRVGQHIENLRLFGQAEEYRAEAEQVSRRLTSEGWNEYLQTRKELADGYMYDLDKVRPLNGNGHNESVPVLSYPLIVSDEAIGEVMVATEGDRETYASEVVAAVVEQLSGHIENLRLLEHAEISRIETQNSREQYKLAVDGANDGVWDWDVTTNQVYFSPRWKSMIGYNEDELINGFADFEKLLHPEDHDWVLATVNDYLSGKLDVYNIEFRFRHKDASYRWILARGKALRHTDGSPYRMAGSHTDITQRKLDENVLAQRANQLETVATLSSTASTVLDPDKLLQAVVDLAKERFGLYHAHIYLADQNWNTLLLASGAGEVGRKMVAEEHSISMDAEKSLVARASRERQLIIANDVRSQPDFLPNPFLPETRAEMAVPLILGDKVLGVFDVQSDNVNGFSKEDGAIYTTLASQVAVALQNARLYVEQAATVTQLRELDRLKSSFLANMSHELRTPLNSILGFTDVMLEGLDGQLTDYMDNDLRLIQKNGQHLMHLINDVLDMAKIESGHMNLNPEKFKVHSVFDDVTSITSTLASEKNIALFIDENSDQDIEIYADNTRLRQVMINLVNNSIKFTHTGKISLCVTPMAGARVLISVKDTGIGIPPDKLEAVFLEFTQVDSSTTRKVGGTGLGLPISRRLVEMHGGRVWAESTGIDGEGSTFYVELPMEARMTEVVEKQEK